MCLSEFRDSQGYAEMPSFKKLKGGGALRFSLPDHQCATLSMWIIWQQWGLLSWELMFSTKLILCTLSYGDPTGYWLWQNPQWPNEKLDPRLSYSPLYPYMFCWSANCFILVTSTSPCNGDCAFFSFSLSVCERERESELWYICGGQKASPLYMGFRAVIRFRSAGSHSKHLYPESHLSSPKGFLFNVRRSFFV